MNSMSLQNARNAYREGKPWRIRLEYYSGGVSYRWWEASGDGTMMASVNFGKTGSFGRAVPNAVAAIKILYHIIGEKCREGYVVVQTKEDLSDLPEPYCHIFTILGEEKGLYKTYDKNGDFLLSMPKDSVEVILQKANFIRNHNHPWGYELWNLE